MEFLNCLCYCEEIFLLHLHHYLYQYVKSWCLFHSDCPGRIFSSLSPLRRTSSMVQSVQIAFIHFRKVRLVSYPSSYRTLCYLTHDPSCSRPPSIPASPCVSALRPRLVDLETYDLGPRIVIGTRTYLQIYKSSPIT